MPEVLDPSCPLVTRCPLQYRVTGFKKHPRRMLGNVDVKGGACEQRPADYGQKLERFKHCGHSSGAYRLRSRGDAGPEAPYCPGRTRSQNIRPCMMSKGGTTAVGMKNAAPNMLASSSTLNPW